MDNITSKVWWQAAGIRALKTACQTAIGVIGAGSFMSEINWMMCLSASLLAALVSILTSLAGLPEVNEEEGEE